MLRSHILIMCWEAFHLLYLLKRRRKRAVGVGAAFSYGSCCSSSTFMSSQLKSERVTEPPSAPVQLKDRTVGESDLSLCVFWQVQLVWKPNLGAVSRPGECSSQDSSKLRLGRSPKAPTGRKTIMVPNIPVKSRWGLRRRRRPHWISITDLGLDRIKDGLQFLPKVKRWGHRSVQPNYRLNRYVSPTFTASNNR